MTRRLHATGVGYGACPCRLQRKNSMKEISDPMLRLSAAGALLSAANAGAQTKLQPIGAASPAAEVQFDVFLPLQHSDQLDQLISVQNTTGSPQYLQWLPPQDFRKRFGAGAGQVSNDSRRPQTLWTAGHEHSFARRESSGNCSGRSSRLRDEALAGPVTAGWPVPGGLPAHQSTGQLCSNRGGWRPSARSFTCAVRRSAWRSRRTTVVRR
jgi:hypothetical protein